MSRIEEPLVAPARPTTRTGRRLRRTKAWIAALLALLFASPALSQIVVSSDLSISLPSGIVHDEEAIIVAGGAAAIVPGLPVIPSPSEVSALHYDALAVLFAVDVTTTIEGIVVEPRDVARWDGVTLTIPLDGSGVGIPDGTRIDAVALSSTGNLLVSFDVSTVVGSLTADDEDLVRLFPSPLLVFDGSAEGIDTALDLNGAGLTPAGLGLVTFDGSGEVDGLYFDDEDVLSWDLSTGDFAMVFDGSSLGPEVAPADLVAVPEPDLSVGIASALLVLFLMKSKRKMPMNRALHTYLAMLVFCVLPALVHAQMILLEGRSTSVTYDVYGGATSRIDRLRIVDGTDLFQNFGFGEVYTALDTSPDGVGTAMGGLYIDEYFTYTGDSVVFDAARFSDGSAESVLGLGVGGAVLSNTFILDFDVITPVDYELTAFLQNDAGGNYTGTISFDDTSLLVPPILNASSSLGTTVFNGTLQPGSYRLRAVMNGSVVANQTTPGPVAGTGDYGLTLELFVPEPGMASMLLIGSAGLAVLTRRRKRHVSAAVVHSILVLAFVFTQSALLAAPATAGDGRIEINQARAIAGGVSAVDGPGFPVTLDQYGNYVLTSNLVVPLDLDGIDVNGSLTLLTAGITLDLNGFSIIGPGTCGGDPLVCTGLGAGSSYGIELRGDAITVRNGSIRGFGQDGIRIQSGNRYRFIDLSIHENGGFGLRSSFGDGDHIRSTIVSDNFSGGIRVGAHCLVADNVVSNNGGIGIDANNGCLVAGNSVDTGTGGTLGIRLVPGAGVSPSYLNNSISSTSSTVLGGVNAGGNVCNGSAVCP